MRTSVAGLKTERFLCQCCEEFRQSCDNYREEEFASKVAMNLRELRLERQAWLLSPWHHDFSS